MIPGFHAANLSPVLAVIVALLPTYLVRFHIPVPGLNLGLPTTLLELMILLVIAVWLFNWLVSGRSPALPALAIRFRWPIIFFLLASFGAVLYSPNQTAAMGLWRAYFFEPIFLFLILIDQIRTRKQIFQIITGLALGALVLSLFAIIQKFTGWLIPGPWQDLAVRRVTSSFSYPNALALYLSPILSLLAGLVFFYKNEISNRWLKSIYIAAIGSGFIALLFTRSVGGLMGLAAGVIFLLLGRAKRKKRAAIAVSGLIIFLALLLAAPLLRENSSQVRLALWYGTSRLLLAHPILGAGLAGFPILYDQYRLARHTELLLYPHNIILNFWVEIGLVGALAFIWLIVNFFELIRDHAKSPLILALAAAMTAILVHGLVDVPYFKNDLAMQFWLILAMAVAAAGLSAAAHPQNIHS